MRKYSSLKDLLDGQKVIPVVTIENETQAVGLTEVLLSAGIDLIEITVRTPYALHAMTVIKQKFPAMRVLAGTVNDAPLMEQVCGLNVDAIISPGVTSTLLQKAQEKNILYIPGIMTPSEILIVHQYGMRECKLFPANIAGEINALKAFQGPLAEIAFCPTGGVNAENFQDYLALKNVLCVGGSWIAPNHLIQAQDWNAISDLCKEAVSKP